MRVNPESLARASSRHPWRTIGAWVVLIVTMGAVSGALLADVLTQDIEFTNRPESVQAQDIIDRSFPDGGAEDTEFFIVHSSSATVSSPEFQQRYADLKREIQQLGSGLIAGQVYSYWDAGAQAEQLLGPHGSVLVSIQLAGRDPAVLTRIRETAAKIDGSSFTTKMVPAGQILGDGSGTSQAQGSSSAAQAPDAFAIVSPTRPTSLDDPAYSAYVEQVQSAIQEAAAGALLAPPVSYFDAAEQAQSLVSGDQRTTLVPVAIRDQSDTTVARLREVAGRVAGDGFTVQVVGNATLNADFTKIAEEDLRKGESIGIMVALIVLVVVFAAIVAALLPIVMAIFAIMVALGLVALLGQMFSFNLFVENMVTMIGLAVGIDYSLFIVSRYREERKKGFDRLDAIGAAGATASRAVFFSGMTVVLALLGMFIIPTTIFRSLATGAIVVTLASVAASMTLLPAMLGLLGDRINWPRLARRARVESSHDPQGGFWDRVTRGVMARPVVFLVVSVLILGGLGSSYFQMNRGTNQNVSQLPSDFESKAAFLTLQREFDAGGASQPVQIVVRGEVGSPQVQQTIATLRREIVGDQAFAKQTQVQISRDGRVEMIDAYFRGDPATNQAFAAIQHLRDDLVPRAFQGVPRTQATVLIGGDTAFFTDFLHVADQYQWYVLAFVLGLSFLLLMVVFRSIVVPIKAIIMNLLSVGAAYGAVTLVFQKGVGIGLFNSIGFQFRQTPAIEAWLPLFLFSILFGLSMDYHVFLLSRIREEYDKTHDNTEAVAYGLRTTAGIITGAALIMVAVFTGFAAGRLGPLQQMGFGLAVAVFMDATIVRTLLVPASMRLLGDANWYLPRRLQWLPRLNVEGHEPELMHVPDTPAGLVDRPRPRVREETRERPR